MDNEWKGLDIANLPPDILVKDAYEFYWKENGKEMIFTMDTFTTFKDAIFPLYQHNKHWDTLYYRKRSPKAPTHEEIMTKWWKCESREVSGHLDISWVKVVQYVPNCPMCYVAMGEKKYRQISKDWFTGRESADIPPEEV